MKPGTLARVCVILVLALSAAVAWIAVRPTDFGLADNGSSADTSAQIHALRAEVVSLNAQINALTGSQSSGSERITNTVRALCQTITGSPTYGYTVELASEGGGDVISGYSSDFQDLVAALARDCRTTAPGH